MDQNRLLLWFLTTLLVLFVLRTKAHDGGLQHSCDHNETTVSTVTVEKVIRDICNKFEWNNTAECKPENGTKHCELYCTATDFLWTAFCVELHNSSVSAQNATLNTVNLFANIEDQPYSLHTHEDRETTDSETETMPDNYQIDDNGNNNCYNHPKCTSTVFFYSTIVLGCISGALLIGLLGMSVVLAWTCNKMTKMRATKKSNDDENESTLDDTQLVGQSNNTEPPSDTLHYEMQMQGLHGAKIYEEIPNTSTNDVAEEANNGEHIYDFPQEKAAVNLKMKQKGSGYQFSRESQENGTSAVFYHVLERSSTLSNENNEQQSHRGPNLEETGKDLKQEQKKRKPQPRLYEDIQLVGVSRPATMKKKENFPSLLNCKEESLSGQPSVNQETGPSINLNHDGNVYQSKVTRQVVPLNEPHRFQDVEGGREEHLGNDIMEEEHFYHVLESPSVVNTCNDHEKSEVDSKSHQHLGICTEDGEFNDRDSQECVQSVIVTPQQDSLPVASIN